MATTKNKSLTAKQENFCQAFVRLADKSAAYREAYDTEKMKPTTINNNAYKLFDNNDITTRIKVLQQEALERNKASVDEIIVGLTGVIRFDPADMYDEKGNLKNIHDMPKHVRMNISNIKSLEEFSGSGSEREFIGHTKEVKVYDKHAAWDKLMRHFGLYEKDNEQSKSDTVVIVNLGDGVPDEAPE